MLNLEGTDFKGERVDPVRELNLDVVECAGLVWKVLPGSWRQRWWKLGFRGTECGKWVWD